MIKHKNKKGILYYYKVKFKENYSMICKLLHRHERERETIGRVED